jgi:hypothetical protein
MDQQRALTIAALEPLTNAASPHCGNQALEVQLVPYVMVNLSDLRLNMAG